YNRETKSRKTTLVREIIKELKLEVGIIIPEIKSHYRIGFKIVDISTGEEKVLASIY
ncbi:MAG TPA: hypothetical protein EYP80_01145, partial [Candidatus Aenigmarchaeota archaeon]|nr:hypothetical protein [Candidatus Aenigmarchaeota archaeon]